MAINFPNNPSVNDTFTVGGINFTFTGVKWESSAVVELSSDTTPTLGGDLDGGAKNINNVGVITATGLDINGDADISGNLSVQGTTTTIDTAITEVDSLNVEGSVGIGTTNPGSKLEVHSDAIPRINTVFQGSKHFGMSVGGSGGGFVLTDGHFITVNHQPYADRGTDNNLTERLRIDSSGSLFAGGSPITESDMNWTHDPYHRPHILTGQTGGNPSDGVVVLASPETEPSNTRVGAVVYGCKTSSTTGVSNSGIKAAIECVTNTNVSDAWKTGGALVFKTRSDNGNQTERLRITSDGQVKITGVDDQDNLVVYGGSTQFVVHQDDTDGEVSLRAQDGSGNNYTKYMTFFTESGSGPTERLRINSSGNVGINSTLPTSQLDVGGTISDSMGPLRRLGINAQTGAYTVTTTDAGKLIRINNTGNITIPTGLSPGDMVSIVSHHASTNTIVQGSGLTLYNTADGSTGNRTLAARGVCTILWSHTDTAYISGSGLS